MRIERVIVRPAPPEEAERLLKDWLTANADLAGHLGKTDLLMELVRGPGGKGLRGYRILLTSELAAQFPER